MSGSFQNVHLRVNDHSTGKPIPASICIQDAKGHCYAPFERIENFPIEDDEDVGGKYLQDGRRFFAIGGACEIRLPVGPLTVEIRKGPEYLPLVESLHLPWGKLALRFTLERYVDLRREGWFSGDTHAFFLTPHEALLEAEAEDIAVINLLACLRERSTETGHKYPYIPNITAFSGQKPTLETGNSLVSVNTFNRHRILGELALLHCHRAVYPLTFGEDGPDDWNLADWCEQCHRKRGLVVATGILSPTQWDQGEILADAILGLVDVLDAAPAGFADFSAYQPWYDLLDCSLKIPLSGGSRKSNNLRALGYLRTYAKILPGEDYTFSNWIEAVRQGRCFATNGPILSLQVNGQDLGSTIEVPHPGSLIDITCSVQSWKPMDCLEIVKNGQVIATGKIAQQGRIYSGKITLQQPVEIAGWLIARCQGKSSHGEMSGAQTSPIFLRILGQNMEPKEETLQKFHQVLEKNLSWIGKNCRFANPEQHDRMASIYKQALQKLAQLGHRT